VSPIQTEKKRDKRANRNRQRAQEPEPAGATQKAREPPLPVSPVIPAIPAIPAISGNSSAPLLFRMLSGTPKFSIAHRRPHGPAAWLRICYNYTLVALLPEPPDSYWDPDGGARKRRVRDFGLRWLTVE